MFNEEVIKNRQACAATLLDTGPKKEQLNKVTSSVFQNKKESHWFKIKIFQMALNKELLKEKAQ